MKEFMLVFRTEIASMPAATPEQAAASTKRYMDWIGGIAAQNKLVDRGNRLHLTGKVVTGRAAVTDGPYMEIKESILGYSIIRAESYEEAADLAKDCPVIQIGGNVEIREIKPL